MKKILFSVHFKDLETIVIEYLKMNPSRKVDHSRRGSEKSSIRSTKGYILKNNDNYTNDEFGTMQITDNTFLMPSIENTLSIAARADITETDIKKSFTNCGSDMQKDKKSTENCLERFQHKFNDLMKQKNEDKSSTKYSIEHGISEEPSPSADNKNIESHNNANSNYLNESLRTKLTDCQLNVNKTENLEATGCQQKHDDLIKQRNEIKSKPTVKSEAVQMQSPVIYNNNIKSCNSNSCFSAESCNSNSCFSIESGKSITCFPGEPLASNQTRCKMNPSKTVGIEEIANNSSKYDILKYFKQKENTFHKDSFQKKIMKSACSKKQLSCEDSTFDSKYNEYYLEEINGRINNAEHEYVKKSKANSNIQKQEVLLNDELLGMLDGLNNDFIQVKELFMNDKNNSSLCNKNNNKNNNIMNRCNVMSAGEDFIDNDIFYNQIITNGQNKYYDFNNFTDLEFIEEFEQNTNTNQYAGCYHDNMEDLRTNQQIICTERNLQQETADGFYQIQSADLKNGDTNNIAHFFSWTNPSLCQCGMMYNKN